MPRKTTLEDRISKHTGVPLPEIEETLSRPYNPTSGRCWPWHSTMSKTTPIVFHEGRPQTVRKVLAERQLGSSISTPLKLGCINLFCVNPNHIRSDVQEDPEQDLMERVETIYQYDPPWDAATIAQATGVYTTEEIQSAIDEIFARNL